MKLRFFLALCCLFSLGMLQEASAEVPESWALCTTCSSKASFESAAIAWYGSRTWPQTVEVGNPDTGVLYQISIQYDATPLGSGSGGSSKTTQASDEGAPLAWKTIQLPDGGQLIMSPDAETDSVPLQDGYPHVTFSFRDSQNEPAFVDFISAAKMGVVTSGPSGAYGFDSFNQQESASVCDALHAAMGQRYPFWYLAEAWTSLRHLVTGYLGRGPYGTMIYNNGDMASFELHSIGPSACVYIKGTAKDKDNNLIPDDGWTSVPYGGGGRMNVSPGGGGGDIPAGIYYRDVYKSCARVGDMLLGCLYY